MTTKIVMPFILREDNEFDMIVPDAKFHNELFSNNKNTLLKQFVYLKSTKDGEIYSTKRRTVVFLFLYSLYVMLSPILFLVCFGVMGFKEAMQNLKEELSEMFKYGRYSFAINTISKEKQEVIREKYFKSIKIFYKNEN